MKKLNNPTQEEWFDFWCQEMIEAGFIERVDTPVDYGVIKLFEKIVKSAKGRNYVILESITYKPDRVLWWTQKGWNKIWSTMDQFEGTYFIAHQEPTTEKYFSLVEVKAPPGYGGRNTSDASFRVKQKWVWEKMALYVNKVYNYPMGKTKKGKFKAEGPYLWMRTFTPTRYFFTDKTFTAKSIKNWNALPIDNWLN